MGYHIDPEVKLILKVLRRMGWRTLILGLVSSSVMSILPPREDNDRCAKCHKDLLPSPLNKSHFSQSHTNCSHIYLLQLTRMVSGRCRPSRSMGKSPLPKVSHLTSQLLLISRYWLGNYRSEIKLLPTIIKPDRSAMTRYIRPFSKLTRIEKSGFCENMSRRNGL